MRKMLWAALALMLAFRVNAQELRCDVRISSSKVQGTNRQIFETLQAAVNEFMNSRAWSNYKFGINERIECSMLFNIQDYSNDQFTGTLQIQSDARSTILLITRFYLIISTMMLISDTRNFSHLNSAKPRICQT